MSSRYFSGCEKNLLRSLICCIIAIICQCLHLSPSSIRHHQYYHGNYGIQRPMVTQLYSMSNNENRRSFLLSSSIMFNALSLPTPTMGLVTDETSSFANTNSDSAYSPQSLGTQLYLRNQEAATTQVKVPTSTSATDEIEISIPISKFQNSSLGIELSDIEFRTNRRVYVKSIMSDSLASQLGIQVNWILVQVNGQSVERTNAQGVKQIISKMLKSGNYDTSLKLVFRDPTRFQDQLQSLSSNQEAVTQVAPAGDTTQRNQDGSIRVGEVTSQIDQKMIVSQIVPPKMCNRGAKVDDLLEISYIGTIVETGDVFDGSAVMVNGKGVPGRGNDVSLFFVLGKQPFGQFPPSWDIGLEGICVGERRRLTIPPVLAYGNKGLPRRNIPPNSTLQYDISLISINGLANPQ